MLTRILIGLMTGVLGLGVASTLPNKAEAHIVPSHKVVIAGTVVYRSVEGSITVKAVPNPDQHPVALKFTATITAVKFQCLNPANNQVTGVSGNRVVIITGVSPFDAENIDKNKGIGSATVRLNTDLVVTNEDCPNPNWEVVTASIFADELLAEFQTADCVATEGDPCGQLLVAYRELQSCVLSGNFGYGKKEAGQPDPGTPYLCQLVEKSHDR